MNVKSIPLYIYKEMGLNKSNWIPLGSIIVAALYYRKSLTYKLKHVILKSKYRCKRQKNWAASKLQIDVVVHFLLLRDLDLREP